VPFYSKDGVVFRENTLINVSFGFAKVKPGGSLVVNNFNMDDLGAIAYVEDNGRFILNGSSISDTANLFDRSCTTNPFYQEGGYLRVADSSISFSWTPGLEFPNAWAGVKALEGVFYGTGNGKLEIVRTKAFRNRSGAFVTWNA